MWPFGKSKARKASESVVKLLDAAAIRLHPDCAFDALDLSLDAKPELASLNMLLGREGDDLFKRVTLKDILDRAELVRSAGRSEHIEATIEASGIEAPSNAVMAAGIHLAKVSGSNEKDFMLPEITQRAELILQLLNQQAGAKR